MRYDGPEIKALLVPTEEPPLDITIKRAMLMYDKVLVADSHESHLIPNGVLHDDYGTMHITYAPFAPYPRIPEYEQSWEHLLNDCSSLVSNNILEVVNIDKGEDIDLPYKLLKHAYHWLASDDELLKLASLTIPRPIKSEQILDFTSRIMRSGVYYGGDISPSGAKVKMYSYPRRAHIPSEDEQLSNYLTDVSLVRLGLILKYLLYSSYHNVNPLTIDEAYNSVIQKLHEKSLSPHYSLKDLPFLNNRAIDIASIIEKFIFTEVINDSVLTQMTFKDVKKLRNKTWHGMQSIRRYLKKRIDYKQRQLESASKKDITEFLSKELSELLKQYEKARIEFIDESVASGITVGLRLISSSTGMSLISNLIFSAGWATTISLCTAAFPAVVGFSAKEIGTLYKQEKQLRRLPIYDFMKGIPKKYCL